MEADLLIIGGGASGTAVLQALAALTPARGRTRRHLRVALVERSTTPGPGLPYGDAADPLHTMGRTATLRHQKGAQLRQRFAAAVARLHDQGVLLTVLTGCEASALHHTMGGWAATTNQGELQAPRAVLATGHWHVHRLEGFARAVDWRWDVRRLHAAIADDEEVIVLGMGQSGLDIALTLAERRTTRRAAGRIHLVSRSGLLPGVFGYIGGTRRNQPTRALEALLDTPAPRLSDVVEATRAGVTGSVTSTDERTPRAWTAEALRASTAGADGVEWLRRDLAAARASLAESKPIPWQPVLWHGLASFHALLPRLCAEDRLTLAANWTALMRHAEAIHAGAAARLLGAIDAGRVLVHATGASSDVGEDSHGVWIRGRDAEVRGHRLVDARGPDPRIGLSDDAVLKRLLDDGTVASGRVRFEGPPAAQRDLPEGWSVEANAHGEWLITGGLWVDPATFEVRTPAGTPTGLHALGPLTLGQFPFYAGLWGTRRAAELIVAALRL